MKRLAGRAPSPALVVACLALFVSLGGVSYGVATGFIDSREIKNNSVGAKDLRNNDVRTGDIRNGTVRGRDVAQDTLTGDDVREIKLGKVPSAALADRAGVAGNAERLGGSAASSYARAAAEPVRIVGEQGQPEFNTGFGQSICADCLPVGFYKDPFGTVHLQGVLDGPGDTTTAFVLPVGYRPAATPRFIISTGNSVPFSPATVFIDDLGEVKIFAGGGVSGHVLDGITFRAAG